MDEGLVIALTHGRSAMTMSDVAEAKMLVELGVTDETIYTPNERDRVATHEAGHATVAYFVGQTRQLDVLSIVKRRDSLGLLQHSDTEERFTQSSEELHALLQIAMGGMVAEEHWFDEVSTGPASDLAAATSIGAQMIGACGMGTSLISVAAAGNGFMEGSLVDKVLGDKAARAELDTLLMGSCDAAKEIVSTHPQVVEALRDALLERDELVGAEITEVIETALQRSPACGDRRTAPVGHGRGPGLTPRSPRRRGPLPSSEHAQHQAAEPARRFRGLRSLGCGLVVLGQRAAEPPVPPASAAVAHVVGDGRERAFGLASPLPVGALTHLMSMAPRPDDHVAVASRLGNALPDRIGVGSVDYGPAAGRLGIRPSPWSKGPKGATP